jgi:hypothetical protein
MEFIEEMGRLKPKKVSELMDIANRFADDENTYHNKRTRSLEDDRSPRYNNQWHRPQNFENYGSHNLVAVGYRDNNDNHVDERRRNSYHADNREKSGPSKSFRPRTSREYNPSPEDILNGPCHMHYAYVDEKRVSNHLMQDCRTFLKLQEAIGSKQAEAQNQGYAGVPRSIAYNVATPPPLPSHSGTTNQGQLNPGNQSDGGYIQSKGCIAVMIQLVPKSKKEQKSISRQVNLAMTSPPATMEYLNWSDQTIGFSRADHPIKVPQPGHTPMVLKAQVGGYDVGRAFMDAGSGINLIYAQTLREMNMSLEFLKPTDYSFSGIV